MTAWVKGITPKSLRTVQGEKGLKKKERTE